MTDADSAGRQPRGQRRFRVDASPEEISAAVRSFEEALARARNLFVRLEAESEGDEEAVLQIGEGLGDYMGSTTLLDVGEDIPVEEARDRRRGKSGRQRHEWTQLALDLAPRGAKRFRLGSAQTCRDVQSKIIGKRNYDGRDESGAWKTPIFANYHFDEQLKTYILDIAYDPDREDAPEEGPEEPA